MKRILKQVAAVIFVVGALSASANTLYQNNFDAGDASLVNFTTFGDTTVSGQDGQAVVSVTSSFGQGGLSLNTASVSGYSTTLSASAGILTWAFNVSNRDGVFNNEFSFIPAGNIANPYDFNFPAHGYSFRGGGYVGDRMLFTRFDHGLNSYQILIDVPAPIGLGTLPDMGSVRLTFDPRSATWSVYMDTGPSYEDPTGAQTLLGSAVDGTYTHTPLGFLSFTGETSGTDYLDNLSITVPEPSSCCLIGMALLTLGWPAYRCRLRQNAKNSCTESGDHVAVSNRTPPTPGR